MNVKDEIYEFKHTRLDCNPSFAQTQPEIVELIDSYWMSKYRDGDRDNQNIRKPFYNIVENPTEVAAKMIDLDTKDVKIIAEDGQSYYPAWLFSKELKIWMKDKNFGKLLNEIVWSLPKYGHVVLKKTAEGIKIVPIQNVVCQPGAKAFLKGDWFIEKHTYTPIQYAEAAEKYGWGEGCIDDEMEVYERYGEVDGGDNYFVICEKGKVLYSDQRDINDFYKELKWEDVPGRALGRGTVEKLFQNQIHQNKIAYLKARGLNWTSKHIYQTRDDTFSSNLTTDVDDGDVLGVRSEIGPVAMEERNLHAYREEEERWDLNAIRRTFTQDVMMGERPPAGTPLGTSILQARMAGGFFDLKREDLGLFLKELIFDWIIPQFKKEKNIVHKLMLGEFEEEELDKIKGLLLKYRTNEAIIDHIARNGIINAEDGELIKSITKKRLDREKELEIPAGYYDNLKYKIDVVITNEQLDVASRMTTLQTTLQMLAANPTIFQDPRTRKILYKLIDLAGFNPKDLQVEEEPELEQVIAQRGGSMARIPPITTPPEAVRRRTL